jgi:hypothetical protein
VQFHSGRPADQWRGFVALDTRNSGEPATRYASTKHHAGWHQHRSDNGGYANAEHIGMRRKHDDESDNARHDGTRQCHGRRGNAWRTATRLLTGQSFQVQRQNFRPDPLTPPQSLARTTKGGFRPPFVVVVDWISAAIAP